ncbi:MAG: MFS transporter [Promethearchaeota archaeon]|jgi:GPH family glycoside/pentoside/hexuronide:cation symporter
MSKKEKTFTRFMRNQILLFGLLLAGDTIFGFFEQNYLNTYIDQVLGLAPLFITLMVTLSAVVGLITNLMWGIKSDNTRGKFGRRRPYLLFGIISGVSMILFAFSINFAGGNVITAYIICIILDVVIIGISSNAYYVSERALIPDTVELEKRGRANGLVNIVGNTGLLIAVASFLVADMIFGQETSEGTVIGQVGHIFTLAIGGISISVASIIGFLLIKEKSVEELPPKKKFFTELKEILNVQKLKENKEFFKIVLALTIFRTGISTIMPFLFIWIFALGLSTLELIFIVLVSFIFLFIVITILGKLSDKQGRRTYIPVVIFAVSLAILYAPLVKIGTSTNIILLLVLFPFILIGILGLDTPMNAWSQDLLPEFERGKFLGILNIIRTISQIVGSFVGGLVATFMIIHGFIPESFVFVFAPIFFLGSIPLFLKVKETLIKD